MSDIQVPDEVIEEAAERYRESTGWGMSEGNAIKDAYVAGVAWARKQALSNMREQFSRAGVVVAGILAGDDHDETFSFEQPTGKCYCGAFWSREHQVREIAAAMFDALLAETKETSA